MKKIFLLFFLTQVFLAEAQTADGYVDHGFVHPGGLHTQADFDRVKRQLSEGNVRVTQAYDVLRRAEYAQATVKTYPVETIVRGGEQGSDKQPDKAYLTNDAVLFPIHGFRFFGMARDKASIVNAINTLQ